MSLTIDEMYEAAAKGETSWEHALLLTGLLYVGTEGLAISPPPENEEDHRFYNIRLDALEKTPSNNNHYKNVMIMLCNHVNN